MILNCLTPFKNYLSKFKVILNQMYMRALLKNLTFHYPSHFSLFPLSLSIFPLSLSIFPYPLHSSQSNKKNPTCRVFNRTPTEQKTQSPNLHHSQSFSLFLHSQSKPNPQSFSIVKHHREQKTTVKHRRCLNHSPFSSILN